MSATLAGVIIVSAGYSTAFVALAVIAAAGFAAYVALMPETLGYRPENASSASRGDGMTPTATART